MLNVRGFNFVRNNVTRLKLRYNIFDSGESMTLKNISANAKPYAKILQHMKNRPRWVGLES